MRLLSFVVAAFMAVSLSAKETSSLEVKWRGMVAEQSKSIKQIEPKELMELIKSDEDFILVDVREPNEVAAGWIEALDLKKIPRGVLDPRVAIGGALKPTQKIVIYCKAGARGVLATKMLQDMGFTNIVNLKGGILEWMKAGYPIVTVNGAFKTVPYELTGCGME